MTDSPRVITLFCEGEPSTAGTHRQRGRVGHDPLDLDARFVADPRLSPEIWVAEGADVQVQKLIHPDDAEANPGMLSALGHVEERFVIRCPDPSCPRVVQLADRLGRGYATMLAAREDDAAGATYRTRSDRREQDRLHRRTADAPLPKAIPAREPRPDIALAIERAGPRLPLADTRLHEDLTRWADTMADGHGVSWLSLSVLDSMIRK